MNGYQTFSKVIEPACHWNSGYDETLDTYTGNMNHGIDVLDDIIKDPDIGKVFDLNEI